MDNPTFVVHVQLADTEMKACSRAVSAQRVAPLQRQARQCALRVHWVNLQKPVACDVQDAMVDGFLVQTSLHAPSVRREALQ